MVSYGESQSLHHSAGAGGGRGRALENHSAGPDAGRSLGCGCCDCCTRARAQHAPRARGCALPPQHSYHRTAHGALVPRAGRCRTKDGRKVAIKHIDRVFEVREDALRIVRELRFLRLLRHANVRPCATLPFSAGSPT